MKIKAAVAMEKLIALVGRQVKITMRDGSEPAGEMTDVKTIGLTINDGEGDEVMWPHAVELDSSFMLPLSSIARIDLTTAANLPSPTVVTPPEKKPAAPKQTKPIRTHKFKGG